MAERKQISVWISAESAALLQRLADEQGQPKNRIIEWALAAYSTSKPTSIDTSDLLDWRTELSNRVLALESRLEAAERVVRTGAVGKEAVSTACEPVGVVPKPVDAEPAIDQGAVKKKNLSDAELDLIVREYLKRSGDKIILAGKLMRKDGISFSQKRLIESRDRVVAADKIKELLER